MVLVVLLVCSFSALRAEKLHTMNREYRSAEGLVLWQQSYLALFGPKERHVMLNEVKHLQELHSDFLRDVSLRST
jgi:hypothetical protein